MACYLSTTGGTWFPMTFACGRLSTIVAFCVMSVAAANEASAAPVLLHDYQLNGSYDDALGGNDIIPLGGSFGGPCTSAPADCAGYVFGPNQGLRLENAFGPANASKGDYTLAFDMSFDTIGGFYKLVDFTGVCDPSRPEETITAPCDAGLYATGFGIPWLQVGFWKVAVFDFPTGPTKLFERTASRMVLTRDDSTDMFRMFVNGIQQFSFVDTYEEAVFNAPNAAANLFVDDFFSIQLEAGGGFVDSVRVWAGAMSPSEVAALGAPSNDGDSEFSQVAPTSHVSEVPEPGTLILVAGGLLIGARSIRRKK
jgi:hypothetical protein